MRLFIAIDIPSEIKQLFERVEQRLKKCDLAAKWVEPKNVHLTLKFLGEVEEQKIPLIKNAMENTAHQFKSFRVSLENFGFFPAERNPRVFFAGTDKEDILRNIYQKIEEELFTIGFGKENRFAAHLTLARFKDKKNIESLKEAIKNISLKETFPVGEIILFKSTLTQRGPIYEEIFKSSLTT